MKNFEFLIFNILLLFFFIKCNGEEEECSECEIISNDENYINNNKCKCPDNSNSCKCNEEKCRPNLYSNSLCYYCPSGLNSYIISDNKCSIKTSISQCNKVTFENNECVSNCGEGYELGDYCFKTCYSNLNLEIKEI